MQTCITSCFIRFKLDTPFHNTTHQLLSFFPLRFVHSAAGVDKAAAGHLNILTWYKHSDLVCVIRRIVYKLKADHSITVTFFQVAGHRYRVVPYEQLTRPEQLNYEMDIRAKARVDRSFQPQASPPPKTIKFEGWSCWINFTRMCVVMINFFVGFYAVCTKNLSLCSELVCRVLHKSLLRLN
jgi:hypothetical protein